MLNRVFRDSYLAEILPARAGLGARIAAFNQKYRMTVSGFARLITTPRQTVDLWVKGKTLPQPYAVALMYVLENSEEARELLGVSRLKIRTKPAGKPKRIRKRDVMKVRMEPAPKHFDANEFVEGPIDMWRRPAKAANGRG